MSKPFVPDRGTAIVRYLVGDLDRAAGFYIAALDFREVHRAGPVCIVARGALHLLLSGPTSSGARTTSAGEQAAGGWNRIVLYVEDLDASIAALQQRGVHFRNAVESGPGGRQILLDDPDGNPVELHEAPRG